MGQMANNRNRRATLDEKKKRAAGRSQNTPEREAIKDSVGLQRGKNQPVAGAHGRGGVANRKGGGGGANRWDALAAAALATLGNTIGQLIADGAEGVLARRMTSGRMDGGGA